MSEHFMANGDGVIDKNFGVLKEVVFNIAHFIDHSASPIQTYCFLRDINYPIGCSKSVFGDYEKYGYPLLRRFSQSLRKAFSKNGEYNEWVYKNNGSNI